MLWFYDLSRGKKVQTEAPNMAPPLWTEGHRSPRWIYPVKAVLVIKGVLKSTPVRPGTAAITSITWRLRATKEPRACRASRQALQAGVQQLLSLGKHGCLFAGGAGRTPTRFHPAWSCWFTGTKIFWVMASPSSEGLLFFPPSGVYSLLFFIQIYNSGVLKGSFRSFS